MAPDTQKETIDCRQDEFYFNKMLSIKCVTYSGTIVILEQPINNGMVDSYQNI